MTSDEVNTTGNGVTFTAEEQIGVFNFDSYDPFVGDDESCIMTGWLTQQQPHM